MSKEAKEELKKKTVVATTVVKKPAKVVPAPVVEDEEDAEEAIEEVAKKPATVVKKTTVVAKKATVDVKHVEKVKKGLTEKKAKSSRIPAPSPIPAVLNGIKNPIVANKRLKQALAVAIAKVAKNEKETVWAGVANSGIAYKQVQTPEQVKNADLLHNANFSGKPYGNWAIANVDTYYKKNKAGVDQCMKFAEVLVKAVKAGKF